MEHLELHVITSHHDAEIAARAGLLSEYPGEDLSCDHCGTSVGSVSGVFYPFAVILDEDDLDWISCDECYTPVVHPAALDLPL
jgi:hypothetical protein